MKTFRIVDCHTNKVHIIQESNFDTALRVMFKKVGHLCVAFV